MLTLHYQYAGTNACTGTHFETVVSTYASTHQEELDRLRTMSEVDDGGKSVNDVSGFGLTEITQTICNEILVSGGWEDGDTVANDIFDLCWDVCDAR